MNKTDWLYFALNNCITFNYIRLNCFIIVELICPKLICAGGAVAF